MPATPPPRPEDITEADLEDARIRAEFRATLRRVREHSKKPKEDSRLFRLKTKLCNSADFAKHIEAARTRRLKVAGGD